MPKDPRIKKVLVIGSGPIIIGQAAEFDYSGTQACRALKAEGIETVLLNSNPATIMTDPDVADHVYIEPMTLEVVERILDIEKPDSVLPNLGGQMGLNLSMELARSGYLDRTGIRLLACKPETIDRAEDRELFKETMEKLHQPIIPSEVVETLQDALDCADRIGYPVIVRPAFTMGGTGGGICETREKLIEIGTNGLRLSPIHQILVEKCIAGWKEIEYEVMRDHKGNVITVCNMENLDPVGIHTGDSVVVAPSQTLTDHEYQMLRTAALDIITELGIEGGCNCQFALKPDSFDYAVIEVNPRVSRSSALASKATGYPIAKVATKIAIGYTLDEITNDVTGKTCACFEPALDYIVVKYPKWPFDKFVYADKSLGTQMMATGEVMSIGNSFEAAMMKAVSSIELGMDTLTHKPFEELTDEEVVEHMHVQDAERVFCVYEALKRGIDHKVIYDITKIDWWFLDKMQHLADLEKGLAQCNGVLSLEQYKTAKKYGFQDKTIRRLAQVDTLPVENYRAGFKMVDTCAAEFSANTPYFYSTYDGDNEAASFIAEKEAETAAKGEPKKKKVLVFGSGPIRIGQGIEFDYCSVHCVWTLKKNGCEAILVNNNPETVSTDFDTGDRLYFDPLNPESVDNIIATEKPDACVVQFGGQTAIKLAKHMDEIGLPILGTPADAIDEAEDRERFDELLERIREIRASERRAYQKIADVFEQCSYDYDKNSETTKAFYAYVQNKLHYAVTGKTAAELIAERATPDSPTMGLTTWKGAPDGKILKSDTLVAKNYLNEKEMSRLNRLVTMFIDYAELMAEDEQLMSMQDWLNETDRFLTNNRRKVLDGKGHISREAAAKKVGAIYKEFRKKQDEAYISEFDRQTEKYLKGE